MNFSRLSVALTSAFCATTMLAADASPAAKAINEFGVELHQRLAAKSPAENLCLSPYSIESALAMTFAGADGVTRTEMAKVLRLPEEGKIHGAFAAFGASLHAIPDESVKEAATQKRHGGHVEPIVLTVANRLFAKQGYTFRRPFLELLSETYQAPLEPVDFAKDPAAATAHINGWVEKQTRERIRDLIPPRAIQASTELVLVNALYLKAPWAENFSERATKPAPFHRLDGTQKDVPTMLHQRHHGFAQRDGFRALTLAYAGYGLQFLILLPDDPKGLPALEKKLTGELLAAQAALPSVEVQLHLPKFKLEPPSFALGAELQAMGMKSAFDQPAGSADFSQMAERAPGQGLVIGEVFHKTFFALDEKGTEAAAATAVLMAPGAAPNLEKPKPIEVKVDHPFLFAIQHRETGACLFLGRVMDPR